MKRTLQELVVCCEFSWSPLFCFFYYLLPRHSVVGWQLVSSPVKNGTHLSISVWLLLIENQLGMCHLGCWLSKMGMSIETEVPGHCTHLCLEYQYRFSNSKHFPTANIDPQLRLVPPSYWPILHELANIGGLYWIFLESIFGSWFFLFWMLAQSYSEFLARDGHAIVDMP